MLIVVLPVKEASRLQRCLAMVFPSPKPTSQTYYVTNHWVVAVGCCLVSMCMMAYADKIPAGHDGFTKNIAPFFEAHCIRCHGPEKSKGKLTLHQLTGVNGGEKEMETWEEILIMLEDGDMPPDDEPQPDDKEREAVTQWIEQSIKAAAEQPQKTVHSTIARRLTNFEYQNTMRDLLGVELDYMTNLTEDPIKPYEFNNSAELMRLGPEQIDRYMENARRAMAAVIVDPEKPEVIKHRKEWSTEIEHEKQKMPNSHVGIHGNGRGSAYGGIAFSDFPKNGPFRFRFKASAILTDGAKEVPAYWVMGESIHVNSSTKRVRPLGTALLTSEEPQVFEFTGRIENFPVETGRRQKKRVLPDGITINPLNIYHDGTLGDDRSFFKDTNHKRPRFSVEWAEFEGPYYETWPPKEHSRILFDSPLRESNKPQYVREVLKRFMSRAYRRPVTESELNRFTKIYELLEPDMPSFEATIRETVAMVLITPQFLMHTIEDDGTTTEQYALASRLSYFLWGSMPDDQLLELASKNQLADTKVIENEVMRMIEDDRSRDFVENFTMQWLSLGKMKTVPINRDLFPRFLFDVSHGERKGTEMPYRPTIRDYMIEETVGFVYELIKWNASATNLVDSKTAYLNQALAAHYGVPGVTSHQHQLVDIQPEHRIGGLLTHGSVLIGNGTGTAPHPIYRAVWLREAILGEKVAPPPAEVPALTDTAGESAEKALSIKDLLKQHRQQESCNDCHARLDPWGIPFEQYNAIGKFQPKVPKEGTRVQPFIPKNHTDLKGYYEYLKTINTVPIDADARVPNGPEVKDMEGLKEFILEHRMHDVGENMIRRFLTYGLGRHLTYQDRPTVDQLLAESKANQYQMKDMIIAICKSDLFRQSN